MLRLKLKQKNFFRKSGQAVIEYLVVASVILLIILGSPYFLFRMKDAFNNYFRQAVGRMR